MLSPVQAMALAIEEGRKGAGFVSPNPLVGCVILDARGGLLAKGFHARVGGDHAEVAALKQVQDKTRLEGAHLYVTLEPCAHQGRTPSCARTLAALPLASVTYGLDDPNPLVSGKGAAILREAGIKTTRFEGLTVELEELAEIFLVNMRLRRPFVAVKAAASLDGKIALENGESRWITGAEARAFGNELRGHYDAVLTGVGTLLGDDPRLDSRARNFAGKAQRLVVLDPEGKTLARLPSLKASQVRPREDLRVITGLNAGGDIELAVENGEFRLSEVLVELQKIGIHSLFVEAGAFTTGRFLKSGLTDRIYLFLAPKVLGAGLSWSSGLTIGSLDSALSVENGRVEAMGGDFLFTGRIRPLVQMSQ